MKYEYEAHVERVVDGDTVDLIVELGFDVKYRMRFRLNGIDAPEKHTEAGKEAHAWLAQRLPIGRAIVVRSMKDKKEKFGRYLAVILDSFPDERSVNDEMVAAGHAKPYDGGKR